MALMMDVIVSGEDCRRKSGSNARSKIVGCHSKSNGRHWAPRQNLDHARTSASVATPSNLFVRMVILGLFDSVGIVLFVRSWGNMTTQDIQILF